jgi:hypothetical protein
MLEAYDTFTEKMDPNATLWRFMDFTKYVSMLHKGALFFTRADRLSDPFEGVRPVQQRERSKEPDPLRRSVLLNSWHENEHESAAMWRIYLSSENGIALQASVASIRSALSACNERLLLGTVQYRDEEPNETGKQHELAAFFCKRKAFDYEREVRVAWRIETPVDAHGRYLRTDLERLVERVVVSPSSERWFSEIVKSVTEKYGVKIPVAESSLAPGIRDPH